MDRHVDRLPVQGVLDLDVPRLVGREPLQLRPRRLHVAFVPERLLDLPEHVISDRRPMPISKPSPFRGRVHAPLARPPRRLGRFVQRLEHSALNPPRHDMRIRAGVLSPPLKSGEHARPSLRIDRPGRKLRLHEAIVNLRPSTPDLLDARERGRDAVERLQHARQLLPVRHPRLVGLLDHVVLERGHDALERSAERRHPTSVFGLRIGDVRSNAYHWISTRRDLFDEAVHVVPRLALDLRRLGDPRRIQPDAGLIVVPIELWARLRVVPEIAKRRVIGRVELVVHAAPVLLGLFVHSRGVQVHPALEHESMLVLDGGGYEQGVQLLDLRIRQVQARSVRDLHRIDLLLPVHPGCALYRFP